MLLKAFDYTMMMGIVSLLEGGEYNQLVPSCNVCYSHLQRKVMQVTM